MSSLDMNPPTSLSVPPTFPSAPISTPTQSVLNLPALGSPGGLLAALSSPPLNVNQGSEEKKEGMAEGFKRFVAFGLRRDSSNQPS
jgi:hypothetical protein